MTDRNYDNTLSKLNSEVSSFIQVKQPPVVRKYSQTTIYYLVTPIVVLGLLVLMKPSFVVRVDPESSVQKLDGGKLISTTIVLSLIIMLCIFCYLR